MRDPEWEKAQSSELTRALVFSKGGIRKSLPIESLNALEEFKILFLIKRERFCSNWWRLGI